MTSTAPSDLKYSISVACTLAVMKTTGVPASSGPGAQVPQGRRAVHVGHHHVEKDQVGAIPPSAASSASRPDDATETW